MPLVDYAHPRATRMARSTTPSASLWVLAAFSWVAIGWVIIGGFASLIAMSIRSGPSAVVYAVLALILLGGVSSTVRNLRRTRAAAALGYLEQAVRLNLPLPPMLRAAERAETGPTRATLAQVREGVEQGRPLADALRQLTGLPLRHFDLILAGERAGQLPQVLRRLVEQDRAAPRNDASSSILLRWYSLLLALTTSAILLMYAFIVMPKILWVMRNFDVPVPRLSLWMGDVAEAIAVVVFPLCALILLAQIGRLTGDLLAPRLIRYNPFRGLIGRLQWWTPLLGATVRHRALADACDVIADAIDAGFTLDAALDEAADTRGNEVLRQRLRRWASIMRGGAPTGDAARAARMPALWVGLLGAARAGGDVQRTMRFLSRYHETRFSRSAQVMRAALIPAMALFFGTIVMGIALSIYLPLIELANRLAAGNGWTSPM